MTLAEKVLDRMMSRDAFSKWMGLEIESVGAGTCKLKFVVKPEMLNGFDIIHGGVVFAASDSAFAFACNSHGRIAVALDVAITFTKSAKVGDALYVEATEQYLGNKTSLYEIKTLNEAGELVAVFKGTAYRTSRPVIEGIS
ncbi:MAG: hotdog fold thioesterase [Saprospiraceae bacterium]|nr:hotdog fold thioesterase [Saprospiraceae bacterium]MCB9343754.1 hotdog fold thioesterase [Lewinellaceae bacterium]